MNSKLSILLCFGLLLLPNPGAAQDHPVEFGLDAGVSFMSWDGEGDDSNTIIGIPAITGLGVAAIRMGFFVTPRVSIEPAFSFARASSEGSSSTLFTLFPSVLYHFKDMDRIALPYVRLGGGLIYYGSSYSYDGDSESDSETQFGLGGGVGVKIPFAETAFVRLEGGFDKWLEKGDPDDYENYDYTEGFKIFRLSIGISAIIN